MSAEIWRGSKCRFDDQSNRVRSRRKPCRDRGAERAPEYDDLTWVDTPVFDQVPPGGLRVTIRSLLIGFALAFTIPAVVDDEDRKTETVKKFDRIQSMRNIPGIAVEKKQGAARPIRGYVLTVQPQTVRCFEKDVFVIETDIRWHRAAEADVREVDKPRLKEIDIADENAVTEYDGKDY